MYVCTFIISKCVLGPTLRYAYCGFLVVGSKNGYNRKYFASAIFTPNFCLRWSIFIKQTVQNKHETLIKGL